jgi:apolipoprotein N-acyltransferase
LVHALSYPLALLSGVLLAVSFPRFGYPPFGWIALTPLLVALVPASRPVSSQRAFALGLLTGVAYFAGTVYWTGATVRTFGGLSLPVSLLVASLLIAYLAVFPALFALILAWIAGRLGRRAIWLAPAIWVASELGRTYFWSGFPWLLLGYSQTTVLPVAQAASLIGVFGLSGLVATVGTGLAAAVVAPGRRAWLSASAPIAVVAALSIWGTIRIQGGRLTSEGRALPIALVQGNVPQHEKWDPARAPAILTRYLDMTRLGARRGARLVIWPESATPFYYEEDSAGAEKIREVVRQTGVRLLFGSDEIQHSTPPRFYNSAFMLKPDGETAAVYRKMQLVPFGEYVPLKSLLFFVEPLVESVADFSPGDAVVRLPVDGETVSTAICYEIVYPGLVRRAIREGSQLLTTITNDAWYGYSSAPHQHFLQASMRAIEQGRYLARAANTGISGIVDPYGRVLARSALFDTTVLNGEVRLLSSLTVYGRIGDLCAYVCLALTLAALVFASNTRIDADPTAPGGTWDNRP